MKAGTTLKIFTAKDGREVILRAPKWSDLDDMLDFINSLIEENAEIAADTKKTRDQEVDWLARHLINIEKDKEIAIVAEIGGKMVGQVQVSPRGGRLRHVGNLGISVKAGYREIGIGTELMNEAEKQAQRIGIEIIFLDVFATTNELVASIRNLNTMKQVEYQEASNVTESISTTYL